MPWLVPSHPAPVLPLKMWRPAAFSGLALCLGAIAPDLEFILRLDRDWIVSHTLPAQLFFTVPIVLALHALVTTVLLPWLVPLLPFGPPWHCEDLVRVRPMALPADVVRVALSGLIGGLSHVFIDGFTHGNHSGWALAFLPQLARPVAMPGGPMPLHDVLQVVATLALGALSLRCAASIGRARLLRLWNASGESAARTASVEEKHGALAYFSACAVLGAATGALRATDGAWIERGAIVALGFTFYGLVFAASADRLRQTWSNRKPDLDPDGAAP